MAHAACIAGKVVVAIGGDVANGAINDQPGELALLRYALHDFSDQSAVKTAVAVNHQHVAGPAHLQGLVDHQVVAATHPYRQRGAEQGHVRAMVRV
ncbi:hypothetical protein D3C72_2326270 [compost metagenome]